MPCRSPSVLVANHIKISKLSPFWLGLALVVVCSDTGASLTADDAHAIARGESMIRVIELHARVATDVVDRATIDQAVLDVMARVPRHSFVADDLQDVAYADRPLPIGHGQTISQPFIVALMTDMLQVEADDVVLEIGTGYQAALLAHLVREVDTIEIIPAYAETAAVTLRELAYDNVKTYVGDGSGFRKPRRTTASWSRLRPAMFRRRLSSS